MRHLVNWYLNRKDKQIILPWKISTPKYPVYGTTFSRPLKLAFLRHRYEILDPGYCHESPYKVRLGLPDLLLYWIPPLLSAGIIKINFSAISLIISSLLFCLNMWASSLNSSIRNWSMPRWWGAPPVPDRRYPVWISFRTSVFDPTYTYR